MGHIFSQFFRHKNDYKLRDIIITAVDMIDTYIPPIYFFDFVRTGLYAVSI